MNPAQYRGLLTLTAPAERIALWPADWHDPLALHQRLTGIHTHDFITLRTSETERAIVARLVALTGMDAEEIREYAREDAAMLNAAEAERHA
jgi:hypothetical protein